MGSYNKLASQGILEERIDRAMAMLTDCSLCPRECGVDRTKGEIGFCRGGLLPSLASFGPHFGEEQCLVGKNGSGTIFFCGCNLLCRFCQNYSLSQATDPGCTEVSSSALAKVMIDLQKQGCHNINFVTPTHFVPQILSALSFAIEDGLKIPLVYNCGGYESIQTLQLLDGIVDIYMPDMKFGENSTANRHAGCPDYPEIMGKAILEMQHQVGDLVIDEDGLATRGLLVRHLLMPGMIDETEQLLQFIGQKVSADCYVNIMDQYRPCGKYTESMSGVDSQAISQKDYELALKYGEAAGLHRIDKKDFTLLLKRLLEK